MVYKIRARIILIFCLSVAPACTTTHPLLEYWSGNMRIPIFPPKEIDVGTTIRREDQKTYASLEKCYKVDPGRVVKERKVDLPIKVSQKGFALNISALLTIPSLNSTVQLKGRFAEAVSIELRYSDAVLRDIELKNLFESRRESCIDFLRSKKYVTMSEVVLATVKLRFLKEGGFAIKLETGLTPQEIASLGEANINVSNYVVREDTLESTQRLAHAYQPLLRDDFDRKKFFESSPKTIAGAIQASSMAKNEEDLERSLKPQKKNMPDLKVEIEEPATKAKELASQISPGEVSAYRSALKAIAERRFPEARLLLENADRKKEVPKFDILLTRARLERYAGEYSKTELLYVKVLKLIPAVKSVGEVDEIATKEEAAIGLFLGGNYSQAARLYDDVVRAQKERNGSTSSEYATSLTRLGILQYELNHFEKAEQNYRSALEIRQELLSREKAERAKRDVAESWNVLAALYRAQRKWAEAEVFYQKAREIREDLGTEHPDVAYSLSGLAGLYRDQGRFRQAEPLYQKAYSIRLKALGKDHPLTAQSLHAWAGLYRKEGNYAKAEPLYEEALKIRLKKLGHKHPALAKTHNNLAQVYTAEKKFKLAEPMFVNALKIREEILGENHPAVAETLEEYAHLLRATQRDEAAEKMEKRAEKIRKMSSR